MSKSSILYCLALAAMLSLISSFNLRQNTFHSRRASFVLLPTTITDSQYAMSRNPLSMEQPPTELLTADKVAELIEVSFVNACLQLAQGFVDVLKLLIAAIKAGYEIGVTPSDLVAKVDSIPDQTAGRQLMPEEIILRNTWIQVVYLTLSSVNHRTNASDTMILDEGVRSSFESIIPDLAARKAAGEQLQLELLLETHKDNFNNLDHPFQKAIMTHSLRVIWITLTVLEEEERCNKEFSRQDAPMPPAPPIPGAF